MLNLKSPIGTNYRIEPNDLMNTKLALNQLGYYDIPPHRGIDDWTDDAMFDGIKRFQKDNGLKVDGFMRPEGPTEQKVNIRLAANEGPSQSGQGKPGVVDTVKQGMGAAGDLLGNYLDMRIGNIKNSDRYFHCKGNCEAARRGPAGETTAETIGNAREWWDQNVKGYPSWDSDEDQKANRTGRAAGRIGGQSCGAACGQYRPNGLPSRY
ncbi:peptidoglycan-binding protein [Magnetospirillum sp. UT-4]|uniref:peptidoglycan-binding protein n=1 Tax=Magnetospirillum sp. UT-4 TaxID=2681467 RepID=UPI00137F1500|nr:peptidoglycan-binding protein [Magnetospirillum sp. UT-4]CAA7614955.1 hypothetical protein MTBUT4_20008 [Magnetospirillum sp. UT-4]